jgi:hypothetical protein
MEAGKLVCAEDPIEFGAGILGMELTRRINRVTYSPASDLPTINHRPTL